MVPVDQVFADVVVDVPGVPGPLVGDPSDVGDEHVVHAIGPGDLRRPERVPTEVMIEIEDTPVAPGRTTVIGGRDAYVAPMNPPDPLRRRGRSPTRVETPVVETPKRRGRYSADDVVVEALDKLRRHLAPVLHQVRIKLAGQVSHVFGRVAPDHPTVPQPGHPPQAPLDVGRLGQVGVRGHPDGQGALAGAWLDGQVIQVDALAVVRDRAQRSLAQDVDRVLHAVRPLGRP